MTRPSSGIPGVEARAWYSPSEGAYYVQRWHEGSSNEVWIAREGTPGSPAEAVAPPDDAFELGANPTEWAYARACEALHAHASRADQAEGRMMRLRQHVMRSVGGRNLPLETLVDLLLARAGVEPPIPAASPAPPWTFDAAMTRVTAIAGDHAGPMVWETVRGALEVVNEVRDPALLKELTTLAVVLKCPLTEEEVRPEWIRS